jgi:hypothetical protein
MTPDSKAGNVSSSSSSSTMSAKKRTVEIIDLDEPEEFNSSRQLSSPKPQPTLAQQKKRMRFFVDE